jgi:SAM-dependent methyltransferase
MQLDEYQKMFEAEERHFWFRASRTIVERWLLRAMAEAGLDQRASLVDVGAGTGGMLSRVSGQAQCLGIEYSPAGVALSRSRGLRVVRGGLPQLPLATASFDLALSMDVFEHVQDDAAAIAEVRRILRPGGRLIATVPALRWLWSDHDVALHHFRRYHLDDLKARLQEGGFGVVRLSYYNTLLLPPIATVRLAGRLRQALGLGAGASAAVSDVGELPGPLNSLLHRIFVSEATLLDHMTLPVGASLIVDARAL